MKLVSFEGGFGRVVDDSVVPMGGDIVAYLNGALPVDGEPLALSAVRLTSPIPEPGKIIGVGLNYRDHANETGQPIPDEPILFAKFATSVVANGDAVVLPGSAPDAVDYEAELAVVIGTTARRVSTSDALNYVAGYTCANDVTARDLQWHGTQWLHGKAIDTFLPLGPWIVTADEIVDPQALTIECSVSGERVQASNTSEMIFGVAELIGFISQTLTLSPGDVICTGTPAGVGYTRTPPRYLRPGDRITVSIGGIGDLTNAVEAEA
jgi:2-keto-4-pentenoate hydratase/2-oxohepta-3-ene-1,7-dioic acid hydratase in catechol pathway